MSYISLEEQQKVVPQGPFGRIKLCFEPERRPVGTNIESWNPKGRGSWSKGFRAPQWHIAALPQCHNAALPQ